jgi:CHAD domain-containing protein
MTANWAAIGRGLAVRRAPRRPPRGARKLSAHRPILAPVTLARALALLGGVGVGVAVAKAQRERRAAARARKRARHAALLPDEARAAGLRRVVTGQLDVAIELLARDPGGSADAAQSTVHEIRKALKRVRAIVRLLRAELGEDTFARENAALRDCGRQLAGARDAEVMVATLDALLQRHPELAAARGGKGVRRLRAQLLAQREAAPGVRDPDLRRLATAELLAIRARVAQWPLRERPGDPARLFAPGLERLYRKGRARRRRARRRQDLQTLHAWRKSAKDLRYAAETLDRGKAAREHAAGRRLHRVARRADRLGELLGEEHDLGLLARTIRAHPEHFAGRKRARKRLLKRIERRRARLRARALREGARLYRRKPKAFRKRLRAAL